MRILVDVDLTVCNVASKWWSWLEEMSVGLATNKDFDEDVRNDNISYNLGEYFELGNGVDSVDFWREEIYDEVKPYKDAVKVLNELCARGHELVFVSFCKGGHFKSKYNMCKRYFPKMSGFVATKEKEQVIRASDIFVDDRHNFLNKSPALQTVKMNTAYSQEETLDRPVTTINNWYEFKDKYKELFV